MKSVLQLTGLALSIGLLIACGPIKGNGGDDNGGASQSDAGPGGGTGTDGPCTKASQCDGDEVCDPQRSECTDDLPCQAHADCGGGGYCNADTCEENSTGGPCDDDINCPSAQSCVGGFCGCNGEQFQAEPVAPNVLIVLDRSDSMDDPVGGVSKWNIARSALTQILSTYGERVRFGLSMYASVTNPGGTACNPGDIDVDIGDNTAQAIQNAYTSTDAETNTPIGSTLQARVGYAGLADTAHPNFVLLLTDGAETCAGNGEAAVTALRNQTPEVRTFVVGFGDEVDQNALNDMATAGGTALPANPGYYQADDAQALSDAFESIIGTVLGCTYQLSQSASDPDSLFVYFDGVPVDRDTNQTGGWDYNQDSDQVTFYGPSCNSLQSGEVTDLVIVYGCGGVD
ncbi:MAG TPA: VWA domain-containing protein [Kofleriaceae bacterium]|nr:VWA domain-containing protein [Kofleriaceae bacterium]